jgi:hypothetical protein
VVLNDLDTGEVLAIMDGKTVTAMRTGAVTGTSIRYLAKKDAASVGLRNLSTTVRHVRATFTEHPQAKRPRFRECLEG